MKIIKNILTALLLFAIIALSSCVDKTPLVQENKIFAGKWVTNDGTWIQIFNDGGGSFEKSNSSVTGGATSITDSTISIGLMGIESTFSINKSPYEENGNLKMELDGNVYIKQ